MRLTPRWQAIYLTVVEEQHSKGNYGSLAKYCPPSDISTHLELIVFAVVGEVRFKHLMLTLRCPFCSNFDNLPKDLSCTSVASLLANTF